MNVVLQEFSDLEWLENVYNPIEDNCKSVYIKDPDYIECYPINHEDGYSIIILIVKNGQFLYAKLNYEDHENMARWLLEVNKQISLLEDLTFTGVDFCYSLDGVVVNKWGQAMPPILKPLSRLDELIDNAIKEYE